MKHWLLQNAIALDQLLNTLFCGGWADETMSSNAYRMKREGKPSGFLCTVIDLLASPFEAGHCMESYISESERRHLPPGERTSANPRTPT